MKNTIAKPQLIKIEGFVRTKLDDLNWIHTQEIRPIAKKLAKLEKADEEIVDVAVLFHDIGKQVAEKNHHLVRLKMTESFLKKIKIYQDFIKEIIYCVRTHAGPWRKLKGKKAEIPKTPEAKVLFDADMIQQLSAFGIVKHLLAHKEKGYHRCLRFAYRDLNNANKLVITKSGKNLAREKFKFVKDFFSQLK